MVLNIELNLFERRTMPTIRKSKDTLGGRIQNLRLDKNDSVNELADYLQTSIKVIYNTESNLSIPSALMLSQIAKKYRVSIDYLIEGK